MVQSYVQSGTLPFGDVEWYAFGTFRFRYSGGHFRYINVTTTILAQHTEQFWHIKMSISVHHRNASIHFIEMLGPYLSRMLSSKFNHIAE